jgi:hypothetical protein
MICNKNGTERKWKCGDWGEEGRWRRIAGIWRHIQKIIWPACPLPILHIWPF